MMSRNQTIGATGYGLGARASSPADLGPLFSQPPIVAGHGEAGVSASDPRASACICGSNHLPHSADVAARASQSRRWRILQFLQTFGPTTIHEFCTACSDPTRTVHAHQVSGRFTDLAKEALIASIGERPHPVSGVACQVYAITPRGQQELASMKTSRARK